MARKRLIRRVKIHGRSYFTQWVCPWCETPFPARPEILETCPCGASVQAGGWTIKQIYTDKPTSNHLKIDDD